MTPPQHPPVNAQGPQSPASFLSKKEHQLKKHQPTAKAPRTKKSTKKPKEKQAKPSITAFDAHEAGKLYAAAAVACEFASQHTDGERKALFLRALRFAATLITDLEKVHRSVKQGVDEAISILTPEASLAKEAVNE